MRSLIKGNKILILLVCALCLSGCGGAGFLKEKIQLTTNETKKEVPEKAEETVSRSKAAMKAPNAQEKLQIEENQVEEKESAVPKSDLETQREEIGLSEAGIASLQKMQSGNYYFERLGNEGKRLYVEMYQILAVQAEEILISAMDQQMLSDVYQAVINDHPEFFYLTGYTYTRFVRGEEVQYITFSGRYLYDKDEVNRRQTRINAAVEAKLGELLKGDTYETVKAVYEYIILSTDYSLDSPDNQNICSVFLDGKSVCNGYAKAVQYLLRYAGIPCIIVNGNAGGSAHAWNIVEIDGAYYHMDATWGDPSYYSQDEEEKNGAPDIDYSYLNLTTAEITKNHNIDQTFKLPDCTAVRDNYFVREGLYVSGYDDGLIGGIFKAAKAQGKNVVCIKASDGQAYRDIYNHLIEQQKIFDYFGTQQGGGEYKIAYSGNEELYTLNFWE